jgi:hypothetical protein
MENLHLSSQTRLDPPCVIVIASFLARVGFLIWILLALLGIWGSAFSIILDTLNSGQKKTEGERHEEIGR